MEAIAGSAVQPISVGALAESFLLAKRASGCTERTITTYQWWLKKYAAQVPQADPLGTHRFFAQLRESNLSLSSRHQCWRTLRTFFRFAVEAGLLAVDPMAGLGRMKAPKTVPHVPEDHQVTALLKACPDTFEGRRNAALVAMLADSALRISEALRLRIEDLNFASLTVRVFGKGQKEDASPFGRETATLLRNWIAKRRDANREDWLFCDARGRPLTRNYGTRIIHRLSKRAKLPRLVSPHALRHYAATSILRQTGDLALVRQVLRHETLTMALRYAHISKVEVAAKFRRASPLDNLRAGR